jgi:hypothetical protein
VGPLVGMSSSGYGVAIHVTSTGCNKRRKVQTVFVCWRLYVRDGAKPVLGQCVVSACRQCLAVAPQVGPEPARQLLWWLDLLLSAARCRA